MSKVRTARNECLCAEKLRESGRVAAIHQSRRSQQPRRCPRIDIREMNSDRPVTIRTGLSQDDGQDFGEIQGGFGAKARGATAIPKRTSAHMEDGRPILEAGYGSSRRHGRDNKVGPAGHCGRL